MSSRVFVLLILLLGSAAAADVITPWGADGMSYFWDEGDFIIFNASNGVDNGTSVPSFTIRVSEDPWNSSNYLEITTYDDDSQWYDVVHYDGNYSGKFMITPGATNSEQKLLHVDDGANFTINTTGAGLNWGGQVISLQADYQDPQIPQVEVDKNRVSAGMLVNINATVIDAVSGIDSVEIRVENGTGFLSHVLNVTQIGANVYGANWTAENYNETMYVRVFAKDLAGNNALNESVELTVDNQGPKFYSYDPEDEGWHNNVTGDICVKLEDGAGVNTTNIWFYVWSTGFYKYDDQSYGEQASETNYKACWSPPMNYNESAWINVEVNATDNLSNFNETSWKFRIDADLPTVGKPIFNETMPTNQKHIQVNSTVSDSLSGMSNCNATLNNGNAHSSFVMSILGDNATGVTDVGEGQYNVTFFCADNAGNLNQSENSTIILDATPPTVGTPILNVNSPSAIGKVMVTSTVSDSVSGISECDVHITQCLPGGPGPSCVGQTLDMDVSGGTASKVFAMDDGDWNITVECEDGAGNTGASGKTPLTVDTLPPTVVIDNPAIKDDYEITLNEIRAAGGEYFHVRPYNKEDSIWDNSSIWQSLTSYNTRLLRRDNFIMNGTEYQYQEEINVGTTGSKVMYYEDEDQHGILLTANGNFIVYITIFTPSLPSEIPIPAPKMYFLGNKYYISRINTTTDKVWLVNGTYATLAVGATTKIVKNGISYDVTLTDASNNEISGIQHVNVEVKWGDGPGQSEDINLDNYLDPDHTSNGLYVFFQGNYKSYFPGEGGRAELILGGEKIELQSGVALPGDSDYIVNFAEDGANLSGINIVYNGNVVENDDAQVIYGPWKHFKLEYYNPLVAFHPVKVDVTNYKISKVAYDSGSGNAAFNVQDTDDKVETYFTEQQNSTANNPLIMQTGEYFVAGDRVIRFQSYDADPDVGFNEDSIQVAMKEYGENTTYFNPDNILDGAVACFKNKNIGDNQFSFAMMINNDTNDAKFFEHASSSACGVFDGTIYSGMGDTSKGDILIDMNNNNVIDDEIYLESVFGYSVRAVPETYDTFGINGYIEVHEPTGNGTGNMTVMSVNVTGNEGMYVIYSGEGEPIPDGNITEAIGVDAGDDDNMYGWTNYGSRVDSTTTQTTVGVANSPHVIEVELARMCYNCYGDADMTVKRLWSTTQIVENFTLNDNFLQNTTTDTFFHARLRTTSGKNGTLYLNNVSTEVEENSSVNIRVFVNKNITLSANMVDATTTVAESKVRLENDTANTEWYDVPREINTSELQDGYYLIHFNVTDEAGNSNEAEKLRIAVDNTPPNAVTGLKATGGNGEVALSWDASDAEDFGKYRVWMNTTNFTVLEDVTFLANTTQRSYTMSGLTNDVTYWFAVTAMDHIDNQNNTFDLVSATPSAPSNPSNPGSPSNPPPAQPNTGPTSLGGGMKKLDKNELEGVKYYDNLCAALESDAAKAGIAYLGDRYDAYATQAACDEFIAARDVLYFTLDKRSEEYVKIKNKGVTRKVLLVNDVDPRIGEYYGGTPLGERIIAWEFDINTDETHTETVYVDGYLDWEIVAGEDAPVVLIIKEEQEENLESAPVTETPLEFEEPEAPSPATGFIIADKGGFALGLAFLLGIVSFIVLWSASASAARRNIRM